MAIRGFIETYENQLMLNLDEFNFKGNLSEDYILV